MMWMGKNHCFTCHATKTDILGDLHDLAKGTPGRLSPDDRTFFENADSGHLGLMTCATIYEAFVAAGSRW